MFNLAGILIFVLSLALFGSFARWARPEIFSRAVTFRLDPFVIIASLLAAIIVPMLVHELIHGLFFRIFTRSKPVFAVRLQYAYAAAPDWFIPARHYWIVGLAPLVLIDVIGLLFIFVVPAGLIPILVFMAALNTAGSVGDMYIVARLIRLSPGSLVKDAGDSLSFFEPAAATSKSA